MFPTYSKRFQLIFGNIKKEEFRIEPMSKEFAFNVLTILLQFIVTPFLIIWFVVPKKYKSGEK